jgi:solute carrier family 25 (mitochondrial S-adenosylmethionine transporter), member 26
LGISQALYIHNVFAVHSFSVCAVDTVKSRLQAPEGFAKAGGFRGIYKGLGIAAVGSAPGAALFFTTYETAKKLSEPYTQAGSSVQIAPAVAHMTSAGMGEFVSSDL